MIKAGTYKPEILDQDNMCIPCCLWACSQRNESCSETHFGTWFRPFPDLKAWFYPLWTQSFFKSGFWNTFWNTKKEVFWIVIRVESLILRTCECKALSERDSCVHILEMSTEAMHAFNQCGRNKILPGSAQILFVIGTALAMLVNAHSSNHDPNHKANRDPKWLSECDSLLCEQAHYECARECVHLSPTLQNYFKVRNEGQGVHLGTVS